MLFQFQASISFKPKCSDDVQQTHAKANARRLTWENVTTPINATAVIVIAGKEASMMTFLYHHKSYRWLIIWLKWGTSLANSIQLIKQDLVKLPLTHSIPAQSKQSVLAWHYGIYQAKKIALHLLESRVLNSKHLPQQWNFIVACIPPNQPSHLLEISLALWISIKQYMYTALWHLEIFKHETNL